MASTVEQIELGQLQKEGNNKDVTNHIVIVVEHKRSPEGDIAGQASDIATSVENRKGTNENEADQVVIETQGNDTKPPDIIQDEASGIEAPTEGTNRESNRIFDPKLKVAIQA